MVTIRKPLAGSIGCSAVILAQCAFADVDYLDMSLEQLLQVQVHGASKKDEPIGSAPAAVYAVTSMDIERSGVTNIPDALRMVPGVEVARSDSNSWAISIRGFKSVLSNKLLVMIDGRSIYTPLFSGVYWDVQDVVLQDVERIEVIRGPGGTVWGANAVNGVVHIITKRADATQGTLLSALGGTEDNVITVARHGGQVGRMDIIEFTGNTLSAMVCGIAN
jgi:iron complex outermembrane recepter protein